MKNLIYILKKYRRIYLSGFFMVLISNTLLIVNPLLFRKAVSAVQEGASNKWVATTCLFLLSLATLSSLFKYWMRMTFISTSRREEREVRSQIFEKIQSQSMTFFDRHGIGELLSRLTNDVSAYRDVLGPGIMYPLFFITLVGPGIAALFYISPPLAAFALLPLFVIPLVNSLVRKSIYRLWMKVQILLAELSGIVQEHFSSIRIIKSFAAEKSCFEKFQQRASEMIGLESRLALTQGLLFPFFTLVTRLATVGLVVLSAALIYFQYGTLSASDFVSFMWIQSYIFFPVIMLAWLLPVYERGRSAYDRLNELYQEPVEVIDRAKQPLDIPPLADIDVTNLDFTYIGASRPSLRGINLKIKGGSFIGITGPIGSGKSTFLRLLNREYEIPRGMIALANRDIHDYPLDTYHSQVATVEQTPFLFSRTIGENVRLGRQEASIEDLERHAEFADLHETVLEFPEQYNTVVGERGVTLSGGQKSRVAIARAFLTDRSILLFDDIFSAVDSKTEQKILKAMKEQLNGKTVILVTHRVSTLESMDKVIYLSDGKVLEEGTPKELHAQNGHYAALWQLQRIGEG